MVSTRFVRAGLAGLCLLAAGCRITPVVPEGPVAAVARQALAAFVLEGRLSIVNGDESVQCAVEWLHAPDAEHWTVLGPFGQIVAQLSASAAGAELMLADGGRWQAASMDELLPAVLPELTDAGFPTERLADWVQAAPGGNAEVRQLDPWGRPQRVIDRGWRIEYTAYASSAPDAAPRRIDIDRGDFRLRLVIDNLESLERSP
ncbi:MAG: outer membrane lipoprotein LolB [Azoarcus sp.]|jgi:outer membrane lipoprotein LolB|nr:outer membrane lipoprotein LolB [Azoarcus sp.]